MDGSLVVWDARSLKTLSDIPIAHKGGVFSVAAHPLSDIFISCGKDNRIRLWDVTEVKKPLVAIATHKMSCEQLKVVWERSAGRAYAVLSNDEDSRYLVMPLVTVYSVSPLSFIPSFGFVWFQFASSCQLDGNVAPKKLLHETTVHDLIFLHPKLLLSCTEKGELCFWSPEVGHCWASLPINTSRLRSIDARIVELEEKLQVANCIICAVSSDGKLFSIVAQVDLIHLKLISHRSQCVMTTSSRLTTVTLIEDVNSTSGEEEEEKADDQGSSSLEEEEEEEEERTAKRKHLPDLTKKPSKSILRKKSKYEEAPKKKVVKAQKHK